MMMVLPKSDTGLPLGAEVMVQARMQKQLALQGYYLLAAPLKTALQARPRRVRPTTEESPALVVATFEGFDILWSGLGDLFTQYRLA